LQAVCFKQIEVRLSETGGTHEKRIDKLEHNYKSQIIETQSAISEIQLDQD